MNDNPLTSPIAHFFIAAIITFIGMFILVPVFFGFVRLFGFYTIVEERTCKVYMLFGKVVDRD